MYLHKITNAKIAFQRALSMREGDLRDIWRNVAVGTSV